MKTCVIFGSETDPYVNLAVEELLLDEIRDEKIILYLWQNNNSVVIGRNQNAYTECRLSALETEGVLLARRRSGGGAVYHDLGNLNFSFVADKITYSLERQQQVILNMAKRLGMPAEISGRNDVTVFGRKFSGNAFLHSAGVSLHHGTILINTNTNQMARYLTPPPGKLKAKGVRSVRSRVVNLSELNPAVTVTSARDALYESFIECYVNAAPERLEISDLDAEKLAGLTARNREKKYNLGQNVFYSAQITHTFSWGNADVRAEITDGILTAIQIYTDALDVDLPTRIESELLGSPLTAEAKGPGGEILMCLRDESASCC